MSTLLQNVVCIADQKEQDMNNLFISELSLVCYRFVYTNKSYYMYQKRNISPYYHEKTAPLLIIKCSLQHPSNETPFQQLRALNLYFMLNQ